MLGTFLKCGSVLCTVPLLAGDVCVLVSLHTKTYAAFMLVVIILMSLYVGFGKRWDFVVNSVIHLTPLLNLQTINCTFFQALPYLFRKVEKRSCVCVSHVCLPRSLALGCCTQFLTAGLPVAASAALSSRPLTPRGLSLLLLTSKPTVLI